MKINFTKNEDVRMAVIKTIGEDLDLLSKIIDARKNNEGMEDDIVFSINGVELDFNNFINYLLKSFRKEVELKAIELLEQKYEKLLGPINEIQEELEHQKNKIYGYVRD